MNNFDKRDSAAADQAKGRTNEVIGKVKQTVGNAVGDRDLEARGAAQRVDGKAERIKGEVKEKIDDGIDRVKAGAQVIKDKITGNDDMRR